jgi:hypothetical protein
MKGLSGTMHELSGVLYRLSDRLTSPGTEQLYTLCDSVFDDVCSTCGMKSACFGAEATRTKEMQSKKITDNLILKSEIYIKCDELAKAEEQINEIIEICKKFKLTENYGKCNNL